MEMEKKTKGGKKSGAASKKAEPTKDVEASTESPAIAAAVVNPNKKRKWADIQRDKQLAKAKQAATLTLAGETKQKKDTAAPATSPATASKSPAAPGEGKKKRRKKKKKTKAAKPAAEGETQVPFIYFNFLSS
jgi:hypothetical protein